MEQTPQSRALEHLAARRWWVAAILTTATLVSYFGFIVGVAYFKPWMGHQVLPGLSRGILAGALVIVAAWAFTGAYVWWANSRYDKALHELR